MRAGRRSADLPSRTPGAATSSPSATLQPGGSGSRTDWTRPESPAADQTIQRSLRSRDRRHALRKQNRTRSPGRALHFCAIRGPAAPLTCRSSGRVPVLRPSSGRCGRTAILRLVQRPHKPNGKPRSPLSGGAPILGFAASDLRPDPDTRAAPGRRSRTCGLPSSGRRSPTPPGLPSRW